MQPLKILLTKRGVIPGLFGGFALPLALVIVSNLPPDLRIKEFKLAAASYVILFLTMPLLGAIVAHFTTEKRIRSQFITAICAPTFILGAFLLYNTYMRAELNEDQAKRNGKLAVQNAEAAELARNTPPAQPEQSPAIPDINTLNGSTPQ